MNEYITNKMPSGLITVDCEGRIVSHNPASERIFDSRLCGKTMFSSIVREADVFRSMLDRCIRYGEVFTRVEFNAPTSNGDKRIGINLSPITNMDGKVEGAICLLSDLTDLVELQRQIKLQENFAALGEMSAGIAHEFKNSLATILGYAQMSALETDSDTLRAYAREIQKESQSLAAIVTDFLNFARPLSAAIQDVDLVDLLDAVITDLRSHRPGDYETDFSANDRAIVPCDATLMRQAFHNLLINAVDAMDGHGTLAVRLDRIFERHKDHVRIVIEDSGPGIPPDQMPKIFLPFFTTKSNGTGLGLSLVQKAVLAHNGRIEVQKVDVHGARFTITLPLSER
jgi:two-component system sensor histidine kinase AtoS